MSINFRLSKFWVFHMSYCLAKVVPKFTENFGMTLAKNRAYGVPEFVRTEVIQHSGNLKGLMGYLQTFHTHIHHHNFITTITNSSTPPPPPSQQHNTTTKYHHHHDNTTIITTSTTTTFTSSTISSSHLKTEQQRLGPSHHHTAASRSF